MLPYLLDCFTSWYMFKEKGNNSVSHRKQLPCINTKFLLQFLPLDLDSFWCPARNMCLNVIRDLLQGVVYIDSKTLQTMCTQRTLEIWFGTLLTAGPLKSISSKDQCTKSCSSSFALQHWFPYTFLSTLQQPFRLIIAFRLGPPKKCLWMSFTSRLYLTIIICSVV